MNQDSSKLSHISVIGAANGDFSPPAVTCVSDESAAS